MRSAVSPCCFAADHWLRSLSLTDYSFLKPSHKYFPTLSAVIVKSSSGPRYVVGCRSQVDATKLKPNTRVALDVTTLTIMRILPREVSIYIHSLQI